MLCGCFLTRGRLAQDGTARLPRTLTDRTKWRPIMNNDTIKGNWEQVKGHVQKKWGELTNDEVDQINGSRKVLAGKIQEKYGRAQDEAEREIDEFENSY
jgi:uncharacterized protein YjbJ (UPF0337 family)